MQALAVAACVSRIFFNEGSKIAPADSLGKDVGQRTGWYLKGTADKWRWPVRARRARALGRSDTAGKKASTPPAAATNSDPATLHYVTDGL